MIPIHVTQIGGARVQRAFSIGGRRVLAGENLTREEVLTIRTANRNALIDKGYLLPWPKNAGAGPGQPLAGVVRFVRPLGFGRGYDVIEGRKVNDEPIADKEAAYALAGIDLPGEKVAN